MRSHEADAFDALEDLVFLLPDRRALAVAL